ncbi:hypothetical protein INP57_17915 [Saccharopolyspora sp. HNM0986]|uniref:hypothetical protein n=1 Tax=Saccharopolyspora galaxeae TaxID=2781241 RepID=UPI00190AB355|nr:hypothetical protein [Saccharopolyspora sp. HNM0986]MBK0868691.1 hypothetical protein [Saccharopolyspora sp. HNM0986]
MPFLLATTVGDQDTFGSFPDILVHDFLPVFALAAGLMAVIWVACAVIMIAGYLIGAVVVFGVRALVNTCVRYVRCRRGVEYAQLVTVDADGAHTKVVSLDRYRRRRQHRRSDGLQSDDTTQPRCDDDPA